MRLWHRLRREREERRGPEADEDPGTYGAPVPWPEARARLVTPAQRAAAAVLEEAEATLAGAAGVEAFALEGSVMLRLVPARSDAAWVGLMAFLEHRDLHVAVDGHWMEWEGEGDADEAAERLRGHVASAVEGRVVVRRCRVDGRWRVGFDLFELRGGRRVHTYSHRYLGDPWFRGERVLTRYAPYRAQAMKA